MPLISHLARRQAAVFHAVTTRPELIGAFAEIYPAVWQALQEQGPPELGAVVAVYHQIGEAELVLSAGVEVPDDITPRDPLASIQLGGGDAGKVDHRGPYVFADFRATQVQLEADLADAGRTPTGQVIERYLTVPEDEPDQSKWHTEIWLPLA